MNLKDAVEDILLDGGAEPGYVVRESEHGTALVEYPEDDEASPGTIGHPASRAPEEELDRCEGLLQDEGYWTDMVPGDRHPTLVVHPRA